MAIQRTAAYLLFANYHDATDDAVPQREVVEPAGNFITRRLIMDEAEWLARPDVWGVELVSEAKRRLAECYSFRWAADDSLACPVCRSLVYLLWTETGFDPMPLDALEWLTRPAEPNEQGKEYAKRLGCVCGNNSLTRYCRHWLRGIISDADLFNKLVEQVLTGVHRRLRHDATPEQLEEFRVRNEQAWNYGRTLALDLCGPNPFRPISFPDTWRSESAVALARTAYDNRNFTLLPILADALEEAGCDNADVLTHCREPDGVHVRGCWVVDGVLGKD